MKIMKTTRITRWDRSFASVMRLFLISEKRSPSNTIGNERSYALCYAQEEQEIRR